VKKSIKRYLTAIPVKYLLFTEQYILRVMQFYTYHRFTVILKYFMEDRYWRKTE